MLLSPSLTNLGVGGAMDDETAALISHIMNEDAVAMEADFSAEDEQLREVMAWSRTLAATGDRVKVEEGTSPSHYEDDILFALRAGAREAQIAADTVLADALRSKIDRTSIQDKMLASQIAAAERKSRIDHEYAKKLQEADASERYDIDHMGDAEQVLGLEAVEAMMANDPNDKGKGKTSSARGKGKGRASAFSPELSPAAASGSNFSLPSLSSSDPYVKCGICLEPFRPTHNPFKASVTATSSAHLSFGLRLETCGHAYCIECLQGYMSRKLDGHGEGKTTVFPIRCPECKDDRDAFSDEVAERIFGTENMEAWYHARVMDSLPKHYCPHPSCSALILLPEDNGTTSQSTCPSCKRDVCVACDSIWHQDLSCEEYQRLPADERQVEDGLLFALAEQAQWKRCPECRVMVELDTGCYHITCRCGAHWCYLCLGKWDKANTRCMSNPPCRLFDEDALRQARPAGPAPANPLWAPGGQARAAAPGPAPAAAAPPPIIAHAGFAQVVQPQNPYRQHPPQAFQARYDPPAPRRVGPVQSWIARHGRLATHFQHAFTSNCVQSRSCPYCFDRFQSENQLYAHLDDAPHPIWFCCGKLFSKEHAYWQHHNANRCVE